jgi:hypothetical protein
MRCSEVDLQTQEMLANNRNTAVKPTAFHKQFIGPHQCHSRSVSLTDDSQTQAAPGQKHSRSYRRFANTGRSGPTPQSVLPTIHKLGPLRADDSQTRAAPGQQHGRSYRRFANTGRSGPITQSVLPTIRKLGPLRANNTVESVHYLGTPDDSKRRESGSISCGNTWPLPVVLAGRSEILHS